MVDILRCKIKIWFSVRMLATKPERNPEIEEHIMARLLLLGMATVLGLGPGVGMAGDLTPREIYEGSSPAVVMILDIPTADNRAAAAPAPSSSRTGSS